MEDEEDISFGNIINIINISKYSSEIIDSLENEEIPSKEKIFSYILDNNKDISLLGLLMLRSEFEKIFKRNYQTEFFTSKTESKSSIDDVSTWVEEYIDYKEDKVKKKIKVELNKDDIINLVYIIEKIYNLLINDLNKEYDKIKEKQIKELKNVLKEKEAKIQEITKKQNIEDKKDKKNKEEENSKKGEEEEKENEKDKSEEEENEEEENEEEENKEKENEEEENEEEENEGYINLRLFLLEMILNIYDLEEKFIKLFLNDNWLKLFDKMCNGKNVNYKTSKLILSIFYFLFSNDKSYLTYMRYIKDKPKIMFRFFVSIYKSLGGCCCPMYYNDTIDGYIMENFDLIIKVIRYAESSQNIDYNLIEAVYKFKVNITQHFINKIGKNSYIFFFRRFARHLKNDDIFALFCKPENLKKNFIKKQHVYSHMIDELDKFAYICESPSIFINALSFLLDRKDVNDILKNKQIFNTMVKCIFITEDYPIKENIFKIIFIKLLDMTLDENLIHNMPKISVLFQSFMDKDDPEILKIYYNNNFFDAGKKLTKAIKIFMDKNYYGYNLEFLVGILNSLVKIGEIIKVQYYSKKVNPLIKELKKNNAENILSRTYYANEILELLKK